MAGIPLLFAQGGHEKLTPEKAARAAQNPAQNPFFALKKDSALKNGFGAKKGPPIFFRPCGRRKKTRCRTQKSKTEAGQLGMKTWEFPPCAQNLESALKAWSELERSRREWSERKKS